ncbi:hypothetical protein BLNAU_11726 [Blattamonas nauphoetae]|uniref:Uncharacterized protein n=1 Tax=Blattamonas nauphoetae TaxID=2049346 RepID=A0ABQ9XLG2_9EUKA|nr:hypothetical protein BLNAU_11726 [Blattamonas nauphoetae]
MQFIITPFKESRPLSAHTDPAPTFPLCDCEIHSELNSTSPLPHTIHIVPPPVDADGRLIDISRISILLLNPFVLPLPVNVPFISCPQPPPLLIPPTFYSRIAMSLRSTE